EVEDLDLARSRDEQVLRLQVAVDDALVVDGPKAGGDAARVGAALAGRQRSAPEPGAQVLSVQQLHHRVGSALLDLQVVDRDDVRVRQRRYRAGLLLQAPERPLVEAPRAGQDLDGHLAPEAAVAGP